MYMTKGNYVDGYVLIVPKKNLAAYKKDAAIGAKIWKKCGALDYKECMGDDLTPDMGMPVLTFPKMTKAKPDDTIWFSFIVYKNRKHRDSVNKKVMAEMAKVYGADAHKDMPFDLKKMAFGGFTIMVNFPK